MPASPVIDDAIQAIELVRPAVPLLAAVDPAAGAIVSSAITILYEGLVALASFEEASSEDAIRERVAAQVTRHLQELAAIKFGAMPDGSGL